MARLMGWDVRGHGHRHNSLKNPTIRLVELIAKLLWRGSKVVGKNDESNVVNAAREKLPRYAKTSAPLRVLRVETSAVFPLLWPWHMDTFCCFRWRDSLAALRALGKFQS